MHDINKYFRFKCYKGFRKLGLDSKPEYVTRLEYELKIIESMGFSSYFLVVCDVLHWARNNGVPTGPGRGSVAGSLVAYCLDITQVDPIKFDLLFERFLNPDRISMPDVDMDFADEGRGQVLEYVRSKYGRDRVASIATYGTLACRGAIKAVARTLGADYALGDKLSKLTPPAVNGVPPKLAKCYESVAELGLWHENPNCVEGKVLRWADQIEDRIDHAGQHASGFIIGDRPLHELIPLQVDKEGNLCSQWDMNEVEKIGLIKFDFLGLTALSIIAHTVKAIKQRHGIDVDITTIPQDDTKVFDRLKAGDTAGIFQVETSSGMRELMIKMQPNDIEDLGALTAIYRPGPLSSDYLSTWLKVRSGEEKPVYLTPQLEPALSKTGGFMIYQETVMKIAVDLAVYTLSESDNLRKAIGKKLPEEMAKHENKLIDGFVKTGIEKNIAIQLWEQIKEFAAYSFNKSHAIAYGLLAYQTAYLKTHYPIEYMCAALTCKKDDVDQVIRYIFNCRELGIKILPPDINKSSSGFSIDDDGNIRFGIAAIKNLGDNIVETLMMAKCNQPFKDLLDLVARVDIGKVNKKKLDSLVRAGAFDYTGHNRASMLAVIEECIEHRKDVRAYNVRMENYAKKLEAFISRNEEIKRAEVNGVRTKLRPLKAVERPPEPKFPVIRSLPELSEKELLAYEKELLGFYVSGHPVDKFKSLIASDPHLSTVEQIKTMGDNDTYIKLIAVPCSIAERTTKSSGKKMASMILEDCTGSISATAFPRIWEMYSHALDAQEPLLLKCKVNMVDVDGTSTNQELVIMEVKTLNHISPTQEIIDLKLPLHEGKILATHNLLKKYAGNETKIRLTLISGDLTQFLSGQTFSIRNREAFVKEFAELG